MENQNNDYETHARSNESLRDRMDGVIPEGRNIQSTESQNNLCSCGNNCGNCCGNHDVKENK